MVDVRQKDPKRVSKLPNPLTVHDDIIGTGFARQRLALALNNWRVYLDQEVKGGVHAYGGGHGLIILNSSE